MPVTTETILAAIACGALSSYLAHRRGKNPYRWFFAGFFLGILGLFIAYFAMPAKKKKSRRKVVAPPPNLKGPVDKLWYYLDGTSQQQGPMSHHALSAAFKQGKIHLSTFVWNEELTEWKSLKEFL